MKLTPSYLDGVMLALNAVPRALAVLDSHRCALERTWVFDALHDWSGRVSASGPFARDRRIFAPNWAQSQLVTGTEGLIEQTVRLVADRFPGQPILVVRGTLSVLVATDIEGLVASLGAELPGPLLEVRREIEDEDWIDGWRRTHDAIFAQLQGDPGQASPHVAGFCLFRREGDELGNRDALARLFSACGWPVPIWPMGCRDEALPVLACDAPRIQFPFASGDPAGERPFVRVPLPIGWSASEAMLRQLGRFFGAEARVDEVVAAERAEIGPRLEAFMTNVLAGKGAVVVADPWTAQGLGAALQELGLGVAAFIVLRRADAEDLDLAPFEQIGGEVMVDPSDAEAAARLQALADRGLADVVIGSALLRDEAELAGLPYVEITGPCRLQHFAAERPYMGFAGLLHLADRLSSAILEGDHRRSIRRRSAGRPGGAS